MPLVLDTSLTLAWLLPDEASDAAEAVLSQALTGREALLAPSLWLYGTANALVSARRRGRLTDAQVTQTVELLEALDVQTPERPAARAVLVATSLRTGLSAYDASYLVLAETSGCPLATLDAKLAQAARDSGVEVLGG
ncbi:type II toxin-antitoxin system VapC family toxin [Microbacterium horticulturae]|uniref:Ribonuclease VapC n=1 Tax=Microbacterium horticulturae TaxID=3028316 RepID=A0ABY8C1U4_9MICO|nr:type II toxin-antitoxin system VapC family toxin [Microbacterium sp. KACC 23027]WEG08598.1 type II toxin-antitoxin system VapC family toxin [Microbacterium sp. KACC 23027]